MLTFLSLLYHHKLSLQKIQKFMKLSAHTYISCTTTYIVTIIALQCIMYTCIQYVAPKSYYIRTYIHVHTYIRTYVKQQLKIYIVYTYVRNLPTCLLACLKHF